MYSKGLALNHHYSWPENFFNGWYVVLRFLHKERGRARSGWLFQWYSLSYYRPIPFNHDYSWWLGQKPLFWQHWWLQKKHLQSSLYVRMVVLLQNYPRNLKVVSSLDPVPLNLIVYFSPCIYQHSLECREVWSRHHFLWPIGYYTWRRYGYGQNNP